MTIRIGDQQFEPRRESYSLLLSREDIDERESAAIDEANAIAAELELSRRRLFDLAEGTEFDTRAAADLKKKLAKIRARARAAGNTLLRIQMEALAQRLEPTPEVEWLLDNLTPGELAALTEELNAARPTRPGSRTESDGS